ncbi:MAG TPA: hypothetical protein VIQ31_20140 [Phormidium sp.]
MPAMGPEQAVAETPPNETSAVLHDVDDVGLETGFAFAACAGAMSVEVIPVANSAEPNNVVIVFFILVELSE